MEEYQLQILADTIGQNWSNVTKAEMGNILNALSLVGGEPGISSQGARFIENLANLLLTLNEKLD